MPVRCRHAGGEPQRSDRTLAASVDHLGPDGARRHLLRSRTRRGVRCLVDAGARSRACARTARADVRRTEQGFPCRRAHRQGPRRHHGTATDAGGAGRRQRIIRCHRQTHGGTSQDRKGHRAGSEIRTACGLSGSGSTFPSHADCTRPQHSRTNSHSTAQPSPSVGTRTTTVARTSRRFRASLP